MQTRFFLLTGWLQVLLLTSAVAQPVLTPQRLLENERFDAILGLAPDHNGRLYVISPVNRCVYVFSRTAPIFDKSADQVWDRVSSRLWPPRQAGTPAGH